jgi:hypothetical protein
MRPSRVGLVLTTGLVLVLFAATVAWVWSGENDPAPRLNELVTSNALLLEDGYGQHPDWIELHNPSDEVVELGGWGLSDGGDPAAAWRFPAVQLEPDEHVVVFASGRGGVDPDGNHHTDFRLDRGGEEVLLVDPDDVVRDRAPAAELVRNQSLGRSPDDPSRWCHYLHPTPGGPNGPVCWSDAALGAPELSHDSGFYDEPIELEIAGTDGGTEIWYTLDGSYPDLVENPDRTRVYDGRIRIEDRTPEPEHLSVISLSWDSDLVGWAPNTREPQGSVPKATVVRARTPHGGETVATYFVGPEHRRDGLGVVALSFDEEYLFDDRTGLFMPGATFDEWAEGPDYDPALGDATPGNFQERGREWERPSAEDLHRPVWFDWCDPSGGCDYQAAVGIRVHGGASRANIRKPVRLYARPEFGADRFQHQFFAPESSVSGHRRLILRTGGNNHNRSILADAYLQSLMGHFDAEVQAAQPAALFLNGEYWGLYLLRERYDQHYLEVVHGADPDTVVVVDLWGPTVEAGDPAGLDAYVDLLEMLAAAEPGGRVARQRIDDTLDLDSFFDFLIAHIFVGNRDWAGNNALVWRQPDGSGDGALDGRWRWMIIDLDLAGRDRFDASHDVIATHLTPSEDPLFRGGIALLYDRVMAHPELRDQFLARFADHLNTTFLPERTVPELDRQAAVIAPEIPIHIARWRSPASVEGWEGHIDTMRDFMEERPAWQWQQLQEHFGLAGTATVTVRSDPDRGTVRLNSLELVDGTPGVLDPTDWSGEYLLDVPIELEATPRPGYRFVRWEGAPQSVAEMSRFRWSVTGPLAVEAVFEPDE